MLCRYFRKRRGSYGDISGKGHNGGVLYTCLRETIHGIYADISGREPTDAIYLSQGKENHKALSVFQEDGPGDLRKMLYTYLRTPPPLTFPTPVCRIHPWAESA